MSMGRLGCQRPAKRDASDPFQAIGQYLIGPLLNATRRLTACGAAFGWVVLEPAIRGRIVRGRDHHTIGQPRAQPAVMGQNGVRNGRRRRVAKDAMGRITLPGSSLHHDVDTIGRKYLDRRVQSWLG